MSNEMNESTQSISRDESIDIMSLLQANAEPTQNSTPAEETPAPEIKKPLTPIQKMMREKEEGSSGVVIENKKSDEPLRDYSLNDDTMNDISKYNDDLAKQILAAEKLQVDKPTNAIEMASLMDRLSDEADKIELTDENRKHVSDILEGKIERVSVPKKRLPVDATEQEIADAEAERVAHEDLVNIIIDKTKMGATFLFTDEEKKKISMSERIHITEVEDVALKTAEFRKPEEGESFNEMINSFQIATTTASVVLPASLWRCTVKGLSFSEMGDISLQATDLTADKLNKKLSVIYNNIINTSLGKFDSYTDFLMKLSYTDIDYLTYALTIATFPEIDQLAVDCKVDRCRQTFNVDYQPRGLLDLTHISDMVLHEMEEVQNASTPDVGRKLAEESKVSKFKAIVLPDSKFVIEVGLASAWDYLHDVGELIDDALSKDYAERHPDDVNGTRAAMSTFLLVIRAIRVPTKDGTYIRYSNANDVVDIMCTISPRDMSIITTVVTKLSTVYAPHFELKDVTCPHCKTHTPSIPISIDQLVFRKFRMLEATDVDLDDMLGI